MKINKYLYTLIFIIICFTGLVSAKTLTFTQVDAMPKSIEKDYYIWRFLTQKNITLDDAKHIITQANHINKKLRIAYKKISGKNPPKAKPIPIASQEKVWSKKANGNKQFQKGLRLLKNNKILEATHYFKLAYQTYFKKYEKDKCLFWLYMSTKEIKYLEKLQESYHPNLYSLLAADALNKKYPKTITEQFQKQSTNYFDITNPIDWAKVKKRMNISTLDQMDVLANDYASQECIGVYTYLKAKACQFKKSYFPMPYRKTMMQFTLRRQALIYAIARQESRFVPASVSRSFALGMMQFMPFLIKDIAKRKGYDIDLDEIFNPKKAIEFANYHLDYLEKYLYHPLFIAYAYNAGIGFTKRYLRNKNNFRRGPYEPYMSIENMYNIEAREYGKKVLVNYVIYLNKLGINTRITPLIMELATPSKTDNFRK